jgi:hypothetical protein
VIQSLDPLPLQQLLITTLIFSITLFSFFLRNLTTLPENGNKQRSTVAWAQTRKPSFFVYHACAFGTCADFANNKVLHIASRVQNVHWEKKFEKRCQRRPDRLDITCHNIKHMYILNICMYIDSTANTAKHKENTNPSLNLKPGWDGRLSQFTQITTSSGGNWQLAKTAAVCRNCRH